MILMNPSKIELVKMDREQGGEHQARAFIDGDTFYVWPVFDALHANMGGKIGVASDAIPLVIGFDKKGVIWNCMVTDYSRNGIWHHNPDVYQKIVSNPKLKLLSSPSLDVSYYDDAIVGDWRNLKEPDDIEKESSNWYEMYVVSCNKKRKLK